MDKKIVIRNVGFMWLLTYEDEMIHINGICKTPDGIVQSWSRILTDEFCGQNSIYTSVYGLWRLFEKFGNRILPPDMKIIFPTNKSTLSDILYIYIENDTESVDIALVKKDSTSPTLIVLETEDDSDNTKMAQLEKRLVQLEKRLITLESSQIEYVD